MGRGNTGSREGQGFSPSSCMLTTYSYTNALKYPEPKYSRLPSPPPSSLLQALMSGSMGRIGGGLMGTPTASTANAAAAASALSPCLGLSSPGFLQVGQGKCGMQMGTVPRRCRPAWGCRHLSSCRWGRGSVGCKCEHGPPHVVVCLHGASFSLHHVPLFPTSPTSSSLPPSLPLRASMCPPWPTCPARPSQRYATAWHHRACAGERREKEVEGNGVCVVPPSHTHPIPLSLQVVHV